MEYKILIVKNRYTKKIDLSYYLDWFKKNTPIEIVTEEMSTDFDVTPQAVSNGTYTGVICSKDILPKLRKVIPENKYNVLVFIYGNDLNGIRVNVANGLNRQDFLYKNTDVVQLVKLTDKGKTLNHEIFHTFFAKLNRLGIPVNDIMDTYQNNGDLKINDVIDTNREIALIALKPYWNEICSLSTNPKPIVNPLSTWKYFKLTEKTGSLGHTVADLDHKLVDKLDELRGICGFPFNITSGYRTVAENAKVGGVSGSAHTQRLAVDIACTDVKKRMTIVGNAWAMGFVGIGIAKDFVHLDIVGDNKRIWLY